MSWLPGQPVSLFLRLPLYYVCTVHIHVQGTEAGNIEIRGSRGLIFDRFGSSSSTFSILNGNPPISTFISSWCH